MGILRLFYDITKHVQDVFNDLKRDTRNGESELPFILDLFGGVPCDY